MKAIILTPRDRAMFHLGQTGLDDTSEILHSDTLFSALANVYAMAFGGADTFIAHLAEGRLRFSSGFHAIRHDAGTLFFLPKPPIRFSGTQRGKKEKSIRYLSHGVWNCLCSRFDPDNCSASIDLLAFPSIGGTFAFLEEELPGIASHGRPRPLWGVIDLPKVKVHTLDKDDRLHLETVVQFSARNMGEQSIQGCYHFLVDHTLDEHQWNEFLAAVRIMADEGIGGQRSSGCGQFESVSVADVNLSLTTDASHFLGLSLVAPEGNDEFHNGLAYYDTMIRGGGTLGRAGNATRHRRQIRLVREGALLKSAINGRLVDVSPGLDGSVLRNGLNFSIPIKAEQ